MAVSKELLDLLLDALAPLGPVVVKRMFGGAALSLDGLTFAIVTADRLWLRTDSASIPRFEAEGSQPFDYATRDGRRVITSYWRAPDRLLDEPDEMVEWARRSHAVARLSPSRTRRRSSPKDAQPSEQNPELPTRSGRAAKESKR